MFIQISIGRNIAQPDGTVGAMHWSLWDVFQNDTVAALLTAVNDAVNHRRTHRINAGQVETHRGTGTWDGVTEESAHLSLFIDHDGRAYNGITNEWRDLKPEIRDSLAAHLRDLAQEYGQDAIAFVVTDSHLATSGK